MNFKCLSDSLSRKSPIRHKYYTPLLYIITSFHISLSLLKQVAAPVAVQVRVRVRLAGGHVARVSLAAQLQAPGVVELLADDGEALAERLVARGQGSVGMGLVGW